MKKLIILFVAIITAVVCLGSCAITATQGKKQAVLNHW